MTDAASAILVAAIEGTTLTEAERRFFVQEQPAGVTLFKRNIPTPFRRVAELISSLKSLYASAAGTPLIAIDQEGGRVARIRDPDFPNLGPTQQLAGGKSDTAALSAIFEYGLAVGQSLAELGINCNFAPVTDVLSEMSNEAIGDRVFGTDATAVIARAGAFLKGMQSTGVLGSLKHFPGQGAATVDTHQGSAVVDVTLDLLRQRDLAPFVALAAQAPMIMVSHCIYPALDAQRPASCSPAVITDLLKDELSYQGVVVSDDMNMGAIAQDEATWCLAMIEAVAAGIDMLLVCEHLERARLALEALRREAARSPAFQLRLEDAAARVRHLRNSLLV